MAGTVQYTLRNIPKELDAILRRRAREQRKTLNQVAVEAMSDGVQLLREPARRRSVRDLVGARPKDPALDAALADQRQIDAELWK